MTPDTNSKKPLSGDPLDICPHCQSDLTAGEIPEAYRKYHNSWDTHYSRRIGVVMNDRVTYWKCPDCNYEWRRQ